MHKGDEGRVKTLLQDFVKHSIPEYILDGSHYILSNGGVQKLSLKKGESFWEVQGNIQGDDFQVYSSELTINFRDENVSHYCNCPDSWAPPP
jgi:non-specific serine/threonine protein kinase